MFRLGGTDLRWIDDSGAWLRGCARARARRAIVGQLASASETGVSASSSYQTIRRPFDTLNVAGGQKVALALR